MQSAAHSNAKKLILDALHLDDSLPGPDAVRRMGTEDWECLLEFARMHRLGPMLHHRLASLADIVPETVWDQLKASQRRHAMRNLKIYRELVTVTRILNDAGIASIALKGAYLAKFAYPDPGLRAMRDLDLLIRPEQVIEAFEILKENGYSTEYEGSPQAYLLSSKHLFPLMGTNRISIELHYCLSDPDKNLVYPDEFIEKLWERSILCNVGGVPVAFLHPEDTLLHLCIHAAVEHQFDLGPLALVDVACLVERQKINWDFLLASISGAKWQRYVLPLLYLTSRRLGAKIPDHVLDELGSGDVETWLEASEYLLFSNPEDHRVLNFKVQDVLYSESVATKFSTFLGIVFPSRSVISQHFPVSPASPVAYLYYPMRWYRLISKKMPMLLQAFSRQQGGELGHLARHREMFDRWLHEKNGIGRAK